jgi:arylsulfatase A-like enzyme
MRLLGLVLALLVAAAASPLEPGDVGAAAPPAQPAPLNILLITVDTLRADHIGPYGGRARTPTLDRLAAEGVRFTNAYAQQPQTNPNHASLFTGQYVSTHGVRVHLHDVLPPGATTLAEVLAGRGYRTGGIYSWFSLDGSLSGLDQGFQTYQNVNVRAGTQEVLPPGAAAAAWERGEDVEALVDGRADVTTDAALDWLEAVTRERSRPFFLWVHYVDPHHPYEPPPPYDELYAPRCDGCVDGSLATLRRLGQGWQPSAEELDRIRAAYDGEITFTDHQIGRLLSRLDTLGLTRRTLVIVTADHGEAFGDHGEWFHGIKLYQPTVRIPLLMRLPGVLPAGAQVDAAVQTIDIMPTILDLAGIPVPSSVEGRSLRPLWQGTDATDRFAIAEVAGGRYLAIIHREWKLIRDTETGRRALFNVREDPAEQHDRLVEQSAQAAQLEAVLNEWIASRAAGRLWRGPTPAPLPPVHPKVAAEVAAAGGVVQVLQGGARGLVAASVGSGRVMADVQAPPGGDLAVAVLPVDVAALGVVPSAVQPLLAFDVRAYDNATGTPVSPPTHEGMVELIVSIPPTRDLLQGEATRVRLLRQEGTTYRILPTRVRSEGMDLNAQGRALGVHLIAVFEPRTAPDDWEIPGGRFFTQTSGGIAAGYRVVDDAEGRAWTAFQRYGGVDGLGYPISQRFTAGGVTRQVFQKGVLVWPDGDGQTIPLPASVMEDLTAAGKDPWLEAFWQIPRAPSSGPVGGSGAEHMQLLDPYPVLREALTRPSDWLERYGLPVVVARMGPAVVLRTQKAVFQLWVEDTPWAAAGQVTQVPVGELARDAGLWVTEAFAPELPVASGSTGFAFAAHGL